MMYKSRVVKHIRQDFPLANFGRNKSCQPFIRSEMLLFIIAKYRQCTHDRFVPQILGPRWQSLNTHYFILESQSRQMFGKLRRSDEARTSPAVAIDESECIKQ